MTTGPSLRLLCLSLTLAAPAPAARGDGAAWRPLKHAQPVLGTADGVWDGDSLCFSNAQHQLRFYAGRRKADVDGTAVWLSLPLEGSAADGSWRLAGIDLDFLQFALLPRDESEARPLRVLLDPGHGGDDDGASGKSPAVKEKNLTLALAKRIGARLKQAGLHVDYTRTHDATLALGDRPRAAREKKADLFISVHANHAAAPDACGVETYILPPAGHPGTAEGSPARGWQPGNRNDFHNTLLGFSIHRNLAATPGAVDRGLKRQAFLVLRETGCPAVLLEFGFLSNPAEARRMLDPEWQERSAAAVADGVLAYARKVAQLDLAVAEKRRQDTEANERWLRHLAEKKAAPAPVPPPPPPAPPPPPPPPSAPAPPPPPPPPPAAETAAAPATVPETIFDFYFTDKER